MGICPLWEPKRVLVRKAPPKELKAFSQNFFHQGVRPLFSPLGVLRRGTIFFRPLGTLFPLVVLLCFKKGAVSSLVE